MASAAIAQGAMLQVRNPRTGEFDRTLAVSSRGEVADKAARLRAAQPAWEALGVEGRCGVMARWLGAVKARISQRLAHLDQRGLGLSVLDVRQKALLVQQAKTRDGLLLQVELLALERDVGSKLGEARLGPCPARGQFVKLAPERELMRARLVEQRRLLVAQTRLQQCPERPALRQHGSE